MRTLDEVLGSLPADERKAVDIRAREIITAYSLKQIRRAVAKTQKDIAAAAGIGQDGVSRIEQRDDMLISTLSEYISALGGELRLVADLPGSAPVEISFQSRKSRRPSKAASRPPSKVPRGKRRASA